MVDTIYPGESVASGQMNTLRRAFAGAEIAWSVGILLATVVASRPASQVSSAGYAFALAIYAAGSLICHQRPGRSFHLLGAQMPVCARCAGIYAGAAVAASVWWLRTLEASHRLPRPYPGPAIRVLLVSALPAAGTLLYEWTTGHTPGNWMRLTSGAPLGATAAWVLLRVN
jgi:Predicted membrane protein (DUF2085)